MTIQKKAAFASIGILLLITLLVLVLNRQGVFSSYEQSAEDEAMEQSVKLLYGIESDNFKISDGTFGSGQTMGQILGEYGVNATTIDKIDRAAEGVFSLKKVRAGHNYTAFTTTDSLAKLAYFVYESSLTDYLVIDLTQDSIHARLEQKEVTVKRLMKSATISSSLWNCMIENGMSGMMAMNISNIYAWSIDFFALQKGDKFTVIYDQKYVDTLDVGMGTIWGATFEHGGKTHYAIPFMNNGKIEYWDENGNSLRKSLLKAPLNYSRISSKFTNGRMHPILRIVRPHQGVDYAAPSGTDVVSVAEGVVTYKGWSGGGGNTLKIKHNSGALSSQYMHLKGYAKGINVGTRVRQGQLIGFVGSTGLSTGPHLDFRLYRGSKAIDPLKVVSEPVEPLKKSLMPEFNIIKERILAEINGTIADSLKVTSLEPVSVEVTDGK